MPIFPSYSIKITLRDIQFYNISINMAIALNYQVEDMKKKASIQEAFLFNLPSVVLHAAGRFLLFWARNGGFHLHCTLPVTVFHQ